MPEPPVPDVEERLKNLALERAGGTPEQFAAFIRAELAKWTKVVKQANIKPD